MPTLDWNKINYDGIIGDPNISFDIGHEIEKASWQNSPFLPFIGKGERRAVRTYTAEKNRPYRPRLKVALTGKGVSGNTDIAANLDNLEILSQTVVPKVVANGVESEILQYLDMKDIDFVKEAVDSLGDWEQDVRDRHLYAALANDPTNCVVCDKDSGFKDTTGKASVKACAAEINTDDVMNVAAIRRAILMANTGIKYNGKSAFPIKPLKSTATSEGGITLNYNSFVIFLDSFQIQQLRSDSEWKDMQNKAPRSENHRIFTGLAGMIDGCPVINMGTWTTMQAGMLNSTISDSEFRRFIEPKNFQNKIIAPSQFTGKHAKGTSIGFLIGAGALIMAGSESTKFYTNKVDEGRKIRCAVDRLLAISKGKFEQDAEGALSPYANTDYAVIAIFSALQ